MSDNRLLPRWIAANAFGELLGLGATFAVGFVATLLIGDSNALFPVLVSGALMVASGAIEGNILGLFQWKALAPALPRLSRRSWLLATVFGALVAWLFGSLPFTLMNVFASQEPTSAQTATEPAQWIVLLGAVGIELVAGCVLAIFQARELRHHVNKPNRWLLANALAWAVGMPIIFIAMDLLFRDLAPWQIALGGVVALLLTGAVVGLIHGLFLVRLVGETPKETV
jgi:hypothetical protein